MTLMFWFYQFKETAAMIGFGTIASFIALIGLIVPVVIHLLSKKTKKNIKFGSLKFLEISKTRTLKSFQLNDILLLLIRSALTICLVLFLTKPFLKNTNNSGALYLLDTDYLGYKELNNVLDTISENSEVRWLTKKLNQLEDTIFDDKLNWYEVNSLSLSYKKVILVSPLLIDNVPQNFDGNLPVDDVINLPQKTTSVQKIPIGNNDYTVKRNQNKNLTLFDFEDANQTIPLKVYFEEKSGQSDLHKIVSATLKSLDEVSAIDFIFQNNPNGCDVVIDLDNKIPISGTYFVTTGYTGGELLRVFNRKIINIKPDISYEEAIRLNFAELFANKLINLFSTEMVSELSFPIEKISAIRNSKEIKNNYTESSIANWLWFLGVFLLFLERFVVFNRK
jgi:hypothetical protein